MKTNFYKPAFHEKGIELFYKNYNDIFISPLDKEVFIAALLQQNPTIEVIP